MAHKKRHHSSHKKSHHKKEHITAHDREIDRENLMHGRKHHESRHEARAHEHRGMERYERGPVKHHSKHIHNPGINHEMDHFNDEMRHEKDMRHGGMGFDNKISRMANRNEFYAGMEPRRRQELEDAGMIGEDPRAIANLPQQVMIKPYPRTGPYMPEGLNDDIRGVDDQMDYDDSQRARHWYPKKV